jgi:hypothetical protein
MKDKIKDIYWWIKHRIDPRHRYHVIKTGLKPGYYDIDHLLLHGCFSLLVRFVEEEKCFEHINWDSDPVHQCVASEIEDLYHWWKFEFPKRETTLNALLLIMYPNDKDLKENKNRKLYEQASERYNFLEQYYIEEENYNLKRLISIKEFLWT